MLWNIIWFFLQFYDFNLNLKNFIEFLTKIKLNYSYNNRADYLPNNTINIIEEEPHAKNIDEVLSEPIYFFPLIFNNNLYEELAKEALFYNEGTEEKKYGKNFKERDAAPNSYLYYYKKYNITKEDIKIFVGAFIFFVFIPKIVMIIIGKMILYM